MAVESSFTFADSSSLQTIVGTAPACKCYDKQQLTLANVLVQSLPMVRRVAKRVVSRPSNMALSLKAVIEIPYL
jgi:hypothetical protein